MVAVLGGVLFAVGLVGTVVSSAAARNLDPDYLIDCFGVSPDPDCDSRRAAIDRANAIVLAFEVVGIAGFFAIVAGAVIDALRRRQSKGMGSKPE